MLRIPHYLLDEEVLAKLAKIGYSGKEAVTIKARSIYLLKKEEGQSIVEAAFVIPLIVLILCGILDFGWIFSNQLTVNNYSREGARYAIVNSDAQDLTYLVTERIKSVSGLGDEADIGITVEVNQEDVKVKVTKSVKVLTPITGIFLPDQQITVESTSIMRIG
ncbi:MAG: TadE/TadG family type IV pilus assembly protein [Eubacteriales bacterium]